VAGVLGGECAMALAAGVNAMLSPLTAIKISQLQVTVSLNVARCI
jgi:acyl transferase domain-containing protein